MEIVTAVPTYRRIVADPAAYFEPDEVKKAKDYQRPLNVARAISLVLNLGLILVVISTHAAVKMFGGIDNWVLQLFVISTAFMFAFSIVDLPISIWHEFSHEKKWGFSTNTPQRYVGDFFKDFVLGTVIQTPLFLALYWLMRKTDMWWLYGWGVFFAFSIVLGMLYPVLIMPIFNKFTPLTDEELGARLRGLAEGVGMKVSGVQVMDASKRTKKDNAFFAGMGRTRRVVVFDNLLKQPAPVIGSVVAHELGHWRRRHILKGVTLGTATTLVLFGVLKLVGSWTTTLDWVGVRAIGEPGSLPLVLLTFATMSSVTGIVSAWFSRAHERQADLDALEISQDYDAFVETEHGLSTRNLIDLTPNWWRYLRASHPPPAERLRLAELWLEKQPKAEPPAKKAPAKRARAKAKAKR